MNESQMRQNETHLPVFEGQKRTQLAKQRFIDSYADHLTWQVAMSCRHAGVSRASYYRWLVDDPVFARECKRTERMCYDYVNDKLMMKIVEGNIRAIIFYLKLYHPDYQSEKRKAAQPKMG